MNKLDIANQINYNGTATRIISSNELLKFKKGDLVKGLSWSNGGEFTIETSKKFITLFILTNNTDGHQVDYDNEEECEILGCENCSKEIEILFNKEFKVINVDKYDKETNTTTVYVESI